MTAPPKGKTCQWRKLSSLVGAFLAFLPNGFSMYWGNLSVYVFSYIYVIKNGDPLKKQAPWLLSVYLIARNIGVIISGKVKNCLGHRFTMLLGISLFNGGLALAFWALYRSDWTLIVALGVLTGGGNGILHAIVMVYVISWSGSHVGFLMSAVMAGYSVGSALTNEGITLYVNPANQEVDLEAGPIMYFSQKNILDNVPNVFLFLTLFSVSFHLLGCLLIRSYSQGKVIEKDSVSAVQQDTIPLSRLRKHGEGKKLQSFSDVELRSSEEDIDQSEPFLNGNNQNENKSLNSVVMNRRYSDEDIDITDGLQDNNYTGPLHNKRTDDTDLKNVPVSKCSRDHQNDYKTHQGDCDRVQSEEEDEDEEFKYDESLTNNRRYNPLSLFRRKEFYILLIVMTTTDMASLVLTTYYKIFGQDWIEDDHFLTNLGTVLSFATTSARLTWGLVIDRCGVKIPTILSIATLSLVTSVYYFTPSINKWCFFISTLLFGCANSAVFTSFHVGTLKLLGKSHFTTNYGLLSLSTIGLNLVAPVIIELVITRYGWHSLFLGTSVLAAVALSWVVLFMPFA